MKQTQAESEIKVFLASSSELDLERAHVGDLFNDINSVLAETAVRLRLLKWEVFDPSFTGERKQSEYDQQVKKADIFIALFRSSAGKYTMEEVDIAITAHTQDHRPEELYYFVQDWEGEREFAVEELKTKLGADFVMDSFADIMDLRYKLVKILSPHLSTCGVAITETDKFIQIGSVNIVRRPIYAGV